MCAKLYENDAQKYQGQFKICFDNMSFYNCNNIQTFLYSKLISGIWAGIGDSAHVAPLFSVSRKAQSNFVPSLPYMYTFPKSPLEKCL